MACEKCAPFEGKWMETPAGLRRCDCPSGQRLSQVPIAHAPVLTPQQTTVFVEMLASIPYFPGDSGARIAIGDELAAMCAGAHEALWLVTRMRRLYSHWPGSIEMRRVYASKHIPWDAVREIGTSEIYPDGIPGESEVPTRAIGASAVRLLASGLKHEVVEDPARAKAIERAAQKMPKMPAARSVGGKFEELLREVEMGQQDRPELPAPTPQIITQADVERAVAELHERKANEAEADL